MTAEDQTKKLHEALQDLLALLASAAAVGFPTPNNIAMRAHLDRIATTLQEAFQD
jgi:hypothetical protein